MAKKTDKAPRRIPDLGKFGRAVLEGFIEKHLGKSAVNVLSAPTDEELAVAAALVAARDRFTKQCDDQALVHFLFVDAPADPHTLGIAVKKFYEHPTDPDFPETIHELLVGGINGLDPQRANAAVILYTGLLREELALVDEEFRHRVHSLAQLEQQRLQREILEALKSLAPVPVVPPPPDTSSVPRQLPPPPADFTGRERNIKLILADFEGHKGALISVVGEHRGGPVSGLVGMGGIGKTALGLMVAHQLAAKYPDGQIFLDLKGTTSPLTAAEVMRHAILCLDPSADVRTDDDSTLSALFRGKIAGKRVLLFLDNARSADQAASLLPGEECALIVTSRWTFGLPGLADHKLGELSPREAAAFLRKICPRVKRDADELAKACAYLPLALRIAGSFLKLNPDRVVTDYITELGDRKRRLVALTDSRQQAGLTTETDVQAALESSYVSLTGDAQQKWLALAVFPAPFTCQAAQYVWDLDEEPARRLLGIFRRYSLLEFNSKSRRYELHDLLADFAQQQLKPDEEIAARSQHAGYYLQTLARADELYLKGGPDTLAGLRLFDTEWEHIQSGQAWGSEHSSISAEALRVCAAFTGHMRCVDLRLHARDKLRWLMDALAADRQLGDRRGEGAALGNLGNAYADLGEPRKAIEFYEQHLAIAREIGDRRGEGAALGNLGNRYADLGEPRKAIEFYEQHLAIAREIGDRRGEGAALGNLGNAYADLGEPRKAIEFYEQHLAIAREIGDRRGEGAALGNLGNRYADLGEPRKAIEFYEQQLTITREIGDRRGEGNALANLGISFKKDGDLSKAKELWEAALQIYVAIESPRAETVRAWLTKLADRSSGGAPASEE